LGNGGEGEIVLAGFGLGMTKKDATERDESLGAAERPQKRIPQKASQRPFKKA